MDIKISEKIRYIGVDDTTLDLFESQYAIPDGVSYNSYLILDEKIAVVDTADERMQKEWEEKLMGALDGKVVDFLIIQHLEPDHTGGILRMLTLFPEITLVGNAKTFLFLSQFLIGKVEDMNALNRLEVRENDKLSLGEHQLHFRMAPMVHWPEVMVTYESTEKILFSADAFGKFGALEITEGDDWACEARRYYFNIVGKYGIAVQNLLCKVNFWDIEMICPAHGPILHQPLDEYIRLYDTWSKYEPEEKGVLIVYGSFHGNSKVAAEYLAEKLREHGEKVVVSDVARMDMSELVEDAFRFDRMILVAASYDTGVFPQIKDFLYRLQSKGYKKRRVGIVENGTWSPSAGRIMMECLQEMKKIEIMEPVVTMYSVMSEQTKIELDNLVKECL